MKQIFEIITLKFQNKMHLMMRGGLLLISCVNVLPTYMKYLKLKLVQHIQISLDKKSVWKRMDLTDFGLPCVLFINLTYHVIFYKLSSYKNCIKCLKSLFNKS